MLVVEAQAGGEGEPLPVDARLVVEGESPGGIGEIAAQHKAAAVPHHGVVGVELVYMVLDKGTNAYVLEGHWSVHAVAAVEAKGTHEPAVVHSWRSLIMHGALCVVH